MTPRIVKKRSGRQSSAFQIQNSARRSQRTPKVQHSRRRNARLQPGLPNSSSPPASCTLGNTVNDRKRKRECETTPPVHPPKHREKHDNELASPGGFTVGEIRRSTGIDVPRVVQTAGPEISLTASPQHRSSEPKRRHSEPEHPSYHRPKRPRVEEDKLIEHWVSNYEWPKSPLEVDTMETFFVRQKTPSLRRTKSNASLNGPSETSSREAKSRPYTDKNYEVFLESKGIFLDDHKDGITSDSKISCRRLLEKDSETPSGTRFDDGVFELTCQRIRKKNETGVIRVIAELIVPSAEGAIDHGRVSFQHLVESVNEGWDSSISLDEDQRLPPPALTPHLPHSRQFRLSRPQPDYAVGFPRQSFSEARLEKLAPFVGEIGDMSFFMSTAYMYFPFMTVEVKCGKAALDIADRQNAHSMTLSVRGVVKLFKAVKREKELHRQILAFSISHDHCSVRIYGHYPVIEGEKTTYYRHPIHKFDFTSLDGKEKWTSYKFSMSVYNDWAPSHFKKICSAIDELPQVNFEVSQASQISQQPEVLHQSELSFSESTGLSQGVGGVDIHGSSFTSVLEEADGLQNAASDAPVTRQSEEGSAEAFNMSKKRRTFR
ncbi:hypothetical protein D8B26_001435 [Coccidioides posadasii str. Silveira]|uniref:DUF7924 domain-containing protein n=1 Tax=Coccidioides posadasii (strain RMSCC 757 / Silveira) TaxID=443226 RepID=E9DJJ7_COCPS|nr:conserved hypothetical protein [Coccidioides posadasii str. Silveira]QVM06729.1 hypothetical protein D8B26_001435 [Coccidioides posadasii str. Silveira]